MDIRFLRFHLSLVLMMFIAILGFSSTSAQESEKKTRNLLVVPYVSRSPETRWLGGLVGEYYFYNKIDSQKVSRIAASLSYTQNRQSNISLYSQLYLNQNYFLYTKILAEKYPDNFYGIGNNFANVKGEKFEPQRADIFVQGQRYLNKQNLLGIGLRARFEKIVKFDTLGQLRYKTIPGTLPYSLLSVGGVYTFDSRNNIYFPNTGSFFKTNAQYFFSAGSQKFEFVNISVDYRRFITLYKRHILAIQAVVDYNIGNLPFQVYATLGGADQMRGFIRWQYRDKLFLMTQAEYRFPIYKRLSGVLFSGVGNVWSGFNSIDIKDLKYAGGVGLRFRINDMKINFRFDQAFSNEGNQGSYVTAIEAF